MVCASPSVLQGFPSTDRGTLVLLASSEFWLPAATWLCSVLRMMDVQHPMTIGDGTPVSSSFPGVRIISPIVFCIAVQWTFYGGLCLAFISRSYPRTMISYVLRLIWKVLGGTCLFSRDSSGCWLENRRKVDERVQKPCPLLSPTVWLSVLASCHTLLRILHATVAWAPIIPFSQVASMAFPLLSLTLRPNLEQRGSQVTTTML